MIERNYIKFICSESDKEQIKERSRSMGFNNLSSYLRSVALGREIISKTDVNSLVELKKIGVNLNQIARRLNTFSSDEYLQNVLMELDKQLANLERFKEIIRSK